jgi:DNA-nicking Smr family endonuclease
VKRRPDDEASLFRSSIGDVKRLPEKDRRVERRKPPPRRFAGRPAPTPADTSRGEAGTSTSLQAGDPLQFARSGTSRTLLRELRRGRFRPEDVLDLHGLSAARAERALRDFLGEALAHGARCVRIVHGKGLHSGSDGPVLKNLVDATLRGTAGVRAFASARPEDGGLGAVNVLFDR